MTKVYLPPWFCYRSDLSRQKGTGAALSNYCFIALSKKKKKKKNRSGYLEHNVTWGILKLQCKTWEFRATSCSRHPNLFTRFVYCLRYMR